MYLAALNSSKRLSLEPRQAHWQICRALEYLQDNYTQEFDLNRVARAVGLSKYYLERVFRRATGLPLQRYMIMLRLESAKKLLECSPKPIADIALELGFFDQSHFTNVFKRFTGVTPRAYRCRKIIDLVSHAGNSASGECCHSLNLTDIHNTWVETRAVLGKGQEGVRRAM
jgi:transcriptional regulator GlxA family with amidase domain